MNDTRQFEYNYSADKAKEVEAITKKYMSHEPDKFEQLKALDRKAERRGQTTSLALGIIGTLILGIGMSIVMAGSATFMILGIIIGIAGIAILATAYPAYKKFVKEDRSKVADQILALSKEIQ